MVQIRLSRYGTNKSAFYRVVVTDRRHPRDGRFIEHIGTFDPAGAGVFQLDQARYAHWMGVGAQASPTVARLVKLQAKSASAA